jgi:ABC-type transport system involved in cytochrome c biogenesis ATPase subunit
MAVIYTAGFATWNQKFMSVDLVIPSSDGDAPRVATTIVTGRNGSHKSTLLKEIVSGLALASREDHLDARAVRNPDRDQVLCISGSVADRFPQKELPGGSRGPFDVPNYTYVGQRVINNLLSKKAPLETMLAFALDPEKVTRFGWKFFIDAHRHAGIRPTGKYILETRRDTPKKAQRTKGDLLGTIQRIRPETDSARVIARPRPHVSFATAQWLLEEFAYEEFTALDAFVVSKPTRRIEVVLSEAGAHCEGIEPNVLRLGLLTDLVRLVDVGVQTVGTGVEFSAMELSSGEYHMFSTILAIGFGVKDKAVLLIDEPENNLHPEWQRDLMAAVYEVCREAMETEGHLIVCTHSPLIVSSAQEGSSLVDMSGDAPKTTLVSYGASSDELLLTQFGVGSSRNKVVVDAVQRAVSLIERGDFSSAEFQAISPELRSIRDALTPSDPMVDVIDALLDEELTK